MDLGRTYVANLVSLASGMLEPGRNSAAKDTLRRKPPCPSSILVCLMRKLASESVGIPLVPGTAGRMRFTTVCALQ